jgi:transcriptional regulator with XRE-family HTH domain
MSIEIGNRLRSLRKARGLSQEAVARQTNIGLKAYGDLERGRTIDPHYSTLEGIAHALGTTVAELVGEKELAPLDKAPGEAGSSQKSEEERRAGYLRAWRAFAHKLVLRWKQDPPKSGREIAVVLDAMQALLDKGAFERPPEQITTSDKREASEWLDLSLLFQDIDRLNQIADAVEADAEAERRRATFREIEGQMVG